MKMKIAPVKIAITGLGVAVLATSLGCNRDDPDIVGVLPNEIFPTTATVSGRVVKGLVTDADCEFTSLVTNEVLYSSVNSSTACTDDNGRYNVTVESSDPSILNQPISVQIKVRTSGTSYVCDFPNGCDNVSFGQNVPLTDTSFSLRAYVPSVSTNDGDTNTVTVSPWTSVAASRADTLRNSGSSISNSITQSYQETASVLNNVLALDQNPTGPQFNGSFYQLDVADITNPNDDVNSSDANLGSMLSLASASLIGLVDSDPNATNGSITKVVNNLASAFQDGVFDVNGTASNIEDNSLGINLASIMNNINSVVTNISGDFQTALNTNLGGGTALTDLGVQVQTVATQKEAVTDADNDPTAPLPIDQDPSGGSGGSGGSGTGGSGGAG